MIVDDKRNAIITGSASGLGRAIALRSARDGWRMALVDVNDTANEETLRLVRQAGGDGFTHHMDVAQPAAWEQLRNSHSAVAAARSAGEQCRRGRLGRGGQVQIDDWHWILGINLNAGIYGCHYFIPWLKKNPRARTSSTRRRWRPLRPGPAWRATTWPRPAC